MSAPGQGVYDPALQPERTLLSWRRTCLSFGAVGLIVARFSVESLGLLAVIVGVVGAGLAVLAYVLASYGYRKVHHSLHRAGTIERDGWPLLCAAAAVLVVGFLCAAAVFGQLLT